MSNVHVTEESRSLRCDLTNIERLEKGRALAEADAECARIEEEKGRVAAQYAAQIKTATARRHELAGAIRQGYEFRDVPCQVQHVYSDREVSVIRLDTGEVIERRGMNPTELRAAEKRTQGNLFLEEETAGPAIQLAETDPDAQAAAPAEETAEEAPELPDETTNATAPGAGEADAHADAQTDGEAAAEPTPAGEAASPAEPEHHRKPRSDKGKPRGPRKVHEPDARDPGFGAEPAGEPSEPETTEPPADDTLRDGPAPTASELLLILPITDPGFDRVLVIATEEELHAVANSEKARSIPQLAVAVKRELRRRASAAATAIEPEEAPELPDDEPDPEVCERCGHSENVHGDSGMRGCMVDGCECRKLRLPLDDPDPLHLDGYDPKAERREADDASA